jgi:hypothetical protein
MTDERPEPGPPLRRWHQALAFALLGRVEPGLGEQVGPQPSALLADLDRLRLGGSAAMRAEIADLRADGRGWPYVVPAELSDGLGAAQFAAALAELRRLLDLDSGPRRVVSGRAPDAAEQALLREVPPHHLS